MLWMVTQTATTLSTGDHSLPRMEAHICMETGTRDGRQGVLLGCGLVTRQGAYLHDHSSTHAANTDVVGARGRQYRVGGGA